MNVIRLTNTSGRCVCPINGKAENTWLGLGQALLANRIEPYEIRNAPKVNASLIRKYHIINFPYSMLKGLLPPPHHLGFAVIGVAMLLFYIRFFKNYKEKMKNTNR
jgi:hypothetical protein